MEDLINDLIPSCMLRLLVWRVSCFSSTLSHILYFKAFWVGYSPSCLNRYSVRVRQKVDAKIADMKQSWSISCFHQFASLWIQIILLLVIHDSWAKTEHHLIMTVSRLCLDLVSISFLLALLLLSFLGQTVL